LRVLVIGGSLGALALNQTVPRALARTKPVHPLEIWHQAGKQKDSETAALYRELEMDARVEAFIDAMDAAYAWADLIVCRAGAMTVSEISAVGLAAILVPYPHAVDDHQTANARYLSEAGAAVLVQQVELTEQRLAEELSRIADGGRAQLLEMAKRARALGRPEATQQVVAHCLEVAGG
jgi:UDP-N-acetylglucosamine--N-acetylmuramyl-(pentapeptide) pyrophosphoryl-undecaprenol N-acetylglucosamine transferase